MPMRGTTIVAALFAANAIMATGALAQEPKTDTPAIQERRNGRPSDRRSVDLRPPSRQRQSQRAAPSPDRTRSFATTSKPMKATTPSTASWCSNIPRARRRIRRETPSTSRWCRLMPRRANSKVRKRGPKTIAGRDGFEAITDDGKGKVNHLVTSSLPATASTCWSPPARAATPRAMTPSASAPPSASPTANRRPPEALPPPRPEPAIRIWRGGASHP